jgi:hypothetical protein
MDSFPCIICGQPLKAVMNAAEAQPGDGIMCETAGNYGSTVHDSMDGQYLAFNICDRCMIRAGGQGRVRMIRKFRLILVTEGPLRRMVVGRQFLGRPHVRWPMDLDLGDEDLVVSLEELEHLPVNCHLDMPLKEIRSMVASKGWSHEQK